MNSVTPGRQVLTRLNITFLLLAALGCYGCQQDAIGGPQMQSATDTSVRTDTTDWAEAPYEKILPYNKDSMLVIGFTPFGDTLEVDTVPIPSAEELVAKFDSVITQVKLDCDIVMMLDLEQERLKIELIRLIDSLERRRDE